MGKHDPEHILQTVNFTPYRGEIEPVTKVHVALINLYANSIEVILHYEYTQVSVGEKREERCRMAEIFPRGMFSVSIASISHLDGLDDERVPAVFISASRPDQVVLRCKSQNEAEAVYQKLKKWIIN